MMASLDRYDRTAEVRAMILEVVPEFLPCPFCGAGGGWPCRDTRDGLHHGAHVERIQQAFDRTANEEEE